MPTETYHSSHSMLRKWAREMPDRVYLRQPVDGTTREWTFAQTHDAVLRFASALRSLGLRRGDMVAILGKNTAEWFIADFAITAAGMISVPIYFTAGRRTTRYILDHSGAKAIIVGKLDDFSTIREAIPENVITIGQPYVRMSCDHMMANLIDQNEPLEDVSEPALDDTFTLIYTSGSTGNPKGVEITFRNIGHGATSAVRNLEFTPTDRLISYLPLAHITERAMIEQVSVQHGCMVSFVESMETFARDLRDARPSVFISVPRLWMKFQAGIMSRIPEKEMQLLLKIPLIRSALKWKIKSTLGLSSARLCASGAAPISPAVLRWYSQLGIEICEGYGMSETSGLVTAHYPFRPDKLGSVGEVSGGAQLKLGPDGEISIRSDGVAKGYYKEPERTAETFIDGWLHTGDKGEIDEHGFIRITGRVKEIFKSAKGKYVAPVPIESLLLESRYLEQVCVMGAGLPQPVAVAVLSPEVSKGIGEDALKAHLGATLVTVNSRLEAHERLSRIVIVNDEWSIESGLITPTLKIRRGQLESRYADLINGEFGEPVVIHS